MKHNKKIVFVLDFIEKGGATRVIEDLSAQFSGQSYLVAGKIDNQKTITFRDEKVFTFPLNFSNSVFGTYFSLFFLTFKAFNRFSEHCGTKKPDLIVGGLPFSSLTAFLHPYAWNIPKDYIFHGAFDLEQKSLFLDLKNNPKTPNIKLRFILLIYYLTQRLALLLASRVIVFSEYSRKIAIIHFKVAESKIITVSPQLTSLPKTPSQLTTHSILPHSKNQFVFLVPSRLEPRKGILELLEALVLLKEQTKQQFVVYCTGALHSHEYALQLFSFCQEHSLTNVHFIKPLTRSDLYRAYKEADLVCMPSLTLETFGLVTLESLSVGTPVVSFNTGATPELLNKIEPRLIAKKTTPQDFYKVLKWFTMLSSSERKQLQIKCKRFYRQYRQNRKPLLNLYEDGI